MSVINRAYQKYKDGGFPALVDAINQRLPVKSLRWSRLGPISEVLAKQLDTMAPPLTHSITAAQWLQLGWKYVR